MRKKILIIEDEEIIAENLKCVLQSFFDGSITVATNATAAENAIKAIHFDLLLVDINLGKQSISGIDLLKKLIVNGPINHLYITANTDDKNIREAIKTEPLGYLEKPFSAAMIKSNIQIAIQKINAEKMLEVNYKGMKKLLPSKEILFIKADNNYVIIYCENNKKYVERGGIKSFLEKLPSNFMQIHRSTIINSSKIDSFSASFVQIEGNQLAIGRLYKEKFSQLYMK